ncbi:MAG: hypothetical protein AABX27_01325 [Nanoarchaeota archaeon]
MGTTTIFTRLNDLGAKFEHLSKEDLNKLGKLSPFSKEEQFYRGWKAAYELHNGNVYVLVFWKGRLMKLEEAPKILNRKYWDKYRGKTLNEYEWTLLKRLILNEVEYLDKEFRKELRKQKKSEPRV